MWCSHARDVELRREDNPRWRVTRFPSTYLSRSYARLSCYISGECWASSHHDEHVTLAAWFSAACNCYALRFLGLVYSMIREDLCFRRFVSRDDQTVPYRSCLQSPEGDARYCSISEGGKRGRGRANYPGEGGWTTMESQQRRGTQKSKGSGDDREGANFSDRSRLKQ